jgi:hypothetical protein
MPPVTSLPLEPAVNWAMSGELIDQFPAAVVVVNCPPFRGALITCRHRRCKWTHALPARAPAPAAVCYRVAESAPRIDRQNCSGSTRVAPRISAHGDANGLSR